jgi:hypothetical protein
MRVARVGRVGLRWRTICAAGRVEAKPVTRLRLRRVSTESVALIPECAECDQRWLPADAERWAAYLTDDEPPELVFYCPACAEREFGGG